MATTHVFIVDYNTFKYHLEYMFVGTGARDYEIDFNNVSTSSLSSTRENLLVSMIADIKRVKKGDYIIFYLQQNKFLKEGLFFGIFKVAELDSDCNEPGFLENHSENQYLLSFLIKSLTFRIIIEPYKVYPIGVTEWEALDEIKKIHSPNQMIWSLIYRKLRANRGNTMITLYESERLFKLIRDKNSAKSLVGSDFTFDLKKNEIIPISKSHPYTGKKECINILPRLIGKYCAGKTGFEAHLQAFLLEDIFRLGIFSNQDEFEWLGNEVSCGVGMQRIDILASFKNEEISNLYAIELKSVEADETIIPQLQRYVDWLQQYYLPNKPSDIIPVIVSKKFNFKKLGRKATKKYNNLIIAINDFNIKNSLVVRYIEFDIDCNDEAISFNEVKY